MNRPFDVYNKQVDQIRQFQKWLKECPIPGSGGHDIVDDFSLIVKSAASYDCTDKPLLRELLLTGIEYQERLWKIMRREDIGTQ